MELGRQPLDAWMTQASLTNHDVVVAAGGNGLTHKMVQKARLGRQLTARSQRKVLAAVNAAARQAGLDLPPLRHQDAFTYIGR